MQKQKNEYKTGVLIAVAAGILYGMGGITGKFCQGEGASPFMLTLIRNLMALPIMYAFCKIKGYSLKIDKRQAAFVFIGGILVSCVTPVLLYTAFDYISVGLTYCLHYTYPVMIALVNFLIFRQKLGKRKLLAMFIAIAAIWIISFSGSEMDAKGIIVALFSGLGYATYVIFIDKTGLRSLPGAVCCFYATLSSSIALLFITVASSDGTVTNALAEWGWILATSVLVVCMGNALIPEAVKKAGGDTVSILGILEPISSTLLGIPLLHEAMSAKCFIGAGMVLVSALLIITEKAPSQKDAGPEKKAAA